MLAFFDSFFGALVSLVDITPEAAGEAALSAHKRQEKVSAAELAGAQTVLATTLTFSCRLSMG